MLFKPSVDRYDELRREWIAEHSAIFTMQIRRAELLNRRIRRRHRFPLVLPPPTGIDRVGARDLHSSNRLCHSSGPSVSCKSSAVRDRDRVHGRVLDRLYRYYGPCRLCRPFRRTTAHSRRRLRFLVRLCRLYRRGRNRPCRLFRGRVHGL